MGHWFRLSRHPVSRRRLRFGVRGPSHAVFSDRRGSSGGDFSSRRRRHWAGGPKSLGSHGGARRLVDHARARPRARHDAGGDRELPVGHLWSGGQGRRAHPRARSGPRDPLHRGPSGCAAGVAGGPASGRRSVMLRPVVRFLGAYFFALAVAVLIIHREASLHPLPQGDVIASVWKEGQLIERVVLGDARQHDARLDRAVSERGGEIVLEKVVADGPILQSPPVVLGVSLVAGHDGVRATLGDKTVYVTPDDILSRQLYDHGLKIQAIAITLGLDTDGLMALVAEKLQTSRQDVEEHASLRRIRVERHRGDERAPITAATLT